MIYRTTLDSPETGREDARQTGRATRNHVICAGMVHAATGYLSLTDRRVGAGRQLSWGGMGRCGTEVRRTAIARGWGIPGCAGGRRFESLEYLPKVPDIVVYSYSPRVCECECVSEPRLWAWGDAVIATADLSRMFGRGRCRPSSAKSRSETRRRPALRRPG